MSDVLLLQEVRDRRLLLHPRIRFNTFQPNKSNQAHNAIVWRRKSLKVVRRNSVPLTPATNVGPSGAGGSVLGAHWMHHIRGIYGSDQPVNLMVIHMVPSVQGHAATAAGREQRRDLFRQDVAGIVDYCDRILASEPVMVGGDWNATPDFDLLEPLKKAGLRLDYLPPASHGNRAIDYTYLRANRICQVTDVDALSGYPGDHKPVLVTYQIN